MEVILNALVLKNDWLHFNENKIWKLEERGNSLRNIISTKFYKFIKDYIEYLDKNKGDETISKKLKNCWKSLLKHKEHMRKII
jgi:predicted ArsR family transcriptional regulator